MGELANAHDLIDAESFTNDLDFQEHVQKMVLKAMLLRQAMYKCCDRSRPPSNGAHRSR